VAFEPSGQHNGVAGVECGEAAKYKLDGAALTQSKMAKVVTRDGQSGYELAAGSYSFQVGIE